MDWFLYDNGLRHEGAKEIRLARNFIKVTAHNSLT